MFSNQLHNSVCEDRVTDVALWSLNMWMCCSSWLDPVPPNATVVFEVEVYSVSRGPRSMEAFKQIDLDKDQTLTKDEVTVTYKLIIITKAAHTEKGWRGSLEMSH